MPPRPHHSPASALCCCALWGLALAAPNLPAAPRDAEFLLLQPSAHAAALGGSYGARRGSLDCLRFNPAGLQGLDALSAAAAHQTAAGDWTHEWAAIGGSWGQVDLAGELQLSSLQSFTLYDSAGQAFDTAGSSSQVLGLAAALPVNRWASAGVEAHAFRSQLYTYESQGYSMDCGLTLHVPGKAYSLGLAVQNLGAQSAYVSEPDPLPLCGRVAAQAAWEPEDGLFIRPALELVDYQDSLRGLELHAGLEATLFDRLDLRGGWMRSGDWQQLSFGLGVHWQQVEVDYAFIPGNELGNSQVLELQVARR